MVHWRPPTLKRTSLLQDLAFNSVAFDEGDIRRCLPGSFEKGRSYHREGAVRDLRADKGGQRLIASVRGTRPRPYHVFVEIDDSDPVVISGRCSCPVGWNCKHAAAVLLEALRNPPQVERVEENVLDGAVGGWLHQLRQAVQPPASPETIAYRLDWPTAPGFPFVIDLRVVRILKSGGWGADRALPSQQLQNPTANYMTPTDRDIIRLLRGGPWSSQLQLSEDAEIADLAMRRILATGRCRWQNVASPPLALGPGRPGRFSWQVGADGRQTVGVALDDPSAVVLPSASPWYVLPAAHLAGPVELDLARDFFLHITDVSLCAANQRSDSSRNMRQPFRAKDNKCHYTDHGHFRYIKVKHEYDTFGDRDANPGYKKMATG